MGRFDFDFDACGSLGFLPLSQFSPCVEHVHVTRPRGRSGQSEEAVGIYDGFEERSTGIK